MLEQHPLEWRPIADAEGPWKDGRPVIVGNQWGPTVATWDGHTWRLTEPGAYAEDTDTEPTHFLPVELPTVPGYIQPSTPCRSHRASGPVLSPEIQSAILRGFSRRAAETIALAQALNAERTISADGFTIKARLPNAQAVD